MYVSERPKAKTNKLNFFKAQRFITQTQSVWYAYFRLYQVNEDSELIPHLIQDLAVPCRSNLYKFLTGLLFDWNWNFQGDIVISTEQLKYLQIIFENQKDYKFWKEGLVILNKEGKEKAWDWIKEQMPLLKLRNKLEG